MLKQMRQCDIFGTTKDIQTYTVEIKNSAGEVKLAMSRDLSQRGLARLQKFIERGAKKPNDAGEDREADPAGDRPGGQ